jgi:hypothetical protein
MVSPRDSESRPSSRPSATTTATNLRKHTKNRHRDAALFTLGSGSPIPKLSKDERARRQREANWQAAWERAWKEFPGVILEGRRRRGLRPVTEFYPGDITAAWIQRAQERDVVPT